MSTDDTTDPAAGGNLIAAEYVLGVLGAEERREVERRLAQEPALASEVAFWEERLGGIADAVPEIDSLSRTCVLFDRFYAAQVVWDETMATRVAGAAGVKALFPALQATVAGPASNGPLPFRAS